MLKPRFLTEFKFNNAAAVILLVFSTVLLYGKILSYSFVSDDYLVLVRVESFLRDKSNIKTLFLMSDENNSLEERIHGYNFSSAEIAFRPIKTLSLFLDYQIWGLRPLGFKLTNLMLHLLNGILLYLLSKYLFKNTLSAFIGALIFLIHPANVETLAVISNRHDLLALFFYFIAFFLFIKTVSSEKKVILKVALSWLCYILAALSKEISVTFLLITAAFIGLYRDKDAIYQKRTALICFFLGTVLITSVIGFIKIYYNPGIAIQHKIYEAGLWVEFLTIFKIFADYARWLILPLDIKFYLIEQYPLALEVAFNLILDLIIVLGLLFLLLIAVLRARFSRAFAGAWLLLTLMPLAMIRALSSTMASRYLYIPSVGFSLLLASLLMEGTGLKRLKSAFTMIILVCYALTSFRISYYWRDNLTLWDKMRKDFPQNAYINMQYYLNHGGIMASIGRDREALQSYLEAYFIAPYSSDAVSGIEKIIGKLEKKDN